jgi:hypothetical protein
LSGRPGPDPSVDPRVVLRILLVACQALSIALTWPLWQVRESPPLPPNLPLIGVPQFNAGFVLLASLVLVAGRPRTGIAAHFALLAFAIAQDETRLQPQVLSIALLLLATLPGSAARFVGLAHLVALWLWSGLHKLMSPEYFTHGGFLVTQRFATFPEPIARGLAVALALLEVGLGLAACFARTRPMARAAGAAFHLGVLLWLSPLVLDWNEAVWPWNVALVFTAWIVLGPGFPSFSEQRRAAPRFARALVAVELVAPAGYQLGLVPAPLAHALYCMSTPHALWFHADGRIDHLKELPELGVFLPATDHALEASFRAQARPGERLLVVEQRPLLRAMGRRERVVQRE